MGKLSGKIALITGGSSGIGLATAKLFRAEGAHLVLTGRDPDKLAAVQTALGGDTLAIPSDAGSVPEIEALMTQIKHHFGRLDVLYLNAGFGGRAPFDEMTEAAFDRVMNMNVKGLFFAIQKALPILSEHASVLITTSHTNRLAFPDIATYAASKAAARSLVQSLAILLAPRGIRVNAISPGLIETDLFRLWPKEEVDMLWSKVASRTPIRRQGTADDVAKVALFVASNDSYYVVGEEIVVDGGIGLVGALGV